MFKTNLCNQDNLDVLSKIINEFIFWYINEIIQSKLDWKTPRQRWDDIMSN
ncbi:hypothetical protein [Mycoplasma sp. 21DD0573]|uniref:hypothetical protein n=1 Tax=unclassified Mycoplasma TaxID=2683645 RepID=UPI002B1D95A6|nr:hypothetical protein [Mycoplasma sp. 21DD0573]MEA4276155.1 hypothetical protein [Mycoplasma sp. 21DD0573]